MGKLSKNKIERRAVEAIEAFANELDVPLKPNIPDGDKGISFDGDIEVFKDLSESVESLIGKVPVQVKGTLVEEFTTGTRKFRIEMEHLKNYLNSQGVLYFVVEIKRNGESKVFYKQLLPMEIYGVLQQYGLEKGQKGRMVELRPLSETDLTSVCIKFMNETKKQPLMLIENKPYEREEYTSYEMTSLTFDPSIGNIFEHDFTLYGVKEKLTVPLEHFRIGALSTEIVETIIIDGKSYELNIEVTKMDKKFILLIENSLELTYVMDSTKFDFKLKKLHSLAAQLKVLPLVLELLEGSNVKFVDLGLTFDLSATKKEQELIQIYVKLHHTFLQFKKVFQQLGVEENLEFGVETKDINKFIHQISNFNEMILEDNYSDSISKLPEFAKYIGFNIGEMRFILYYNPDAKPKFLNAFSENFPNKQIYVKCNDAATPYTPYPLFNSSTLAYCCNVNIDVIKESFNNVDPFVNDEVANITNDFCLKCINAYDLSKNVDFLDLAEHIYEKYTGDTLTPEILYINQIQIKKRRVGKLSEADIDRLYSIKLEHAGHIEMNFCTSVLLESIVEAKLSFERLKKEEQENFKVYPIYKLYRDLNETEPVK
ncbi:MULTISPECIES: DUF4365 domain-containing protein [Bacillus cereus group]|uniref:Uncharacterized protein n=1 Tax=Bacillus cereus VD118 TaxID=1053231 RepID=R8Q8L9_BACCE|nr:MULTISPECIES: DUF4365 domain-containing protein [Bacillus cereus group]EOP67405.1 hypothetical protein IIQ_05358 [Bacillus cereus VD118]MBJ8095375.1 DUF4365 domain-containing protein [Bacillus cereus]MCQ6359507.1 DUF4365 domain-containing protein [Bacillus cereus]CAH2464430.1 hypothetical protein ACOSJ1_EBGNOMHC_04964 [Bacillus mycoides KBAB4]